MPAIRHVCPIQGCDVTVSRKQDVKRHLATHDEAAKNRWACPFDGCKTRAMTQRSNMVYHIWNMHARDSSPIRRSTPPSKSAKIPLKLARLVEADRVDSVSSVQACMGAFHVGDTHDMNPVPRKVEEQDHPLNVGSDATSPIYVPSLSPSSSASSSESPPSLENVPCPTFGYDLPTASSSTASESFNDSDLVSQSISITNSMYSEVLSTPSCDINACPEPLPTIPVHDDVYSLQYWNALAPTFIPAHGLVNPLTDFQPELQNPAQFDFGLNSTDPSAYFPTNVPSYGAHMPEQSLEYQPNDPSLLPNSHDFGYDDLFLPSVNPTENSGLDFSYFDPSWDVSAPLDNFDALNYF